jgi:DNA-binding SARP family transcriptional activator
MQVRILGPLQVVVDGRSVPLGGPRQQVVFASLALEANHVVGIDRLVDAVWEDPPPTARRQIQISVSTLRRALAGAGAHEVIQTHPAGYLLRIAAGQLDAEIFLQAVAEGRALAERGALAQAAGRLQEALALWRGPALTGLDSAAVAAGTTRLEEARLSAVESRVEVELALGRHDRLIGELRSLVAQHPLRERLQAALMLALYRSGRQAEALQVYRDARTVLIDDLGIEPGEQLQRLERAILSHDPDLDPPDAEPVWAPLPALPAPLVVPRQLPADIVDFTGREELVAAIGDFLAGDAGADALRVLAIAGKGGAGKSSLAVHAAHRLSGAFPDGQLYAGLRGSGPQREDPTQVLGRFLGGLGVSGQAIPDDPEERAQMYRSRLAGSRVLVVLDDAADADHVRPLLPGTGSCAALVTSRVRLTDLPGVHQVTVDTLDAGHALELVTRIIGAARVAAEPAEAGQLVRLCGRLPLALRVASSRLVSRPHWPLRHLVALLRDEERVLDELDHGALGVRGSIALSVDSLSPDAARLFRLLALPTAPDAGVWVAAALLDTSLTRASRLLEGLLDVQLLESTTCPVSGSLRYRYHDLIRAYAREQLAAEPAARQRGAVERMVGAALAMTDQAHRGEYGGDYAVLHGQAPRWWPPHSDPAGLVEDPMTWWESECPALVAIIEQAAGLGLHEACWDLALTSVTLFEARKDFDDWQRTTQVALAAARDGGNRRGWAAMEYSLGMLHLRQGRPEQAEGCLAEARARFDALAEPHGRALVLRGLAEAARQRGAPAAEVGQRYAAALDALRQVDDRAGAAAVLGELAGSNIEIGQFDAARSMIEEALRICREIGCLRVAAQARYRLGELALRTGETGLARQAFTDVLQRMQDTGDRGGQAGALSGLGVAEHHAGELDRAESLLRAALDLADHTGDRLAAGQAMHALGEVSLTRGEVDAAADRIRQAGEILGAAAG